MKKLLISCLAILMFAGCPEPPPPPPAATPIPTPRTFSHIVSFQGENLGKIAKWYTGSVDNWKAIAEANPEINPKKLIKGNILIVPYDLVTNFEPMPKKFVSPPPARSKRKKEETFVVDDSSSTTVVVPTPDVSTPAPVRTVGPIITAPSVPVVIENNPVPTAAPTTVPPTPTSPPIEKVAPTLPPAAPTQPTAEKSSSTEAGGGEKSMEDLVAEEKRVLEQLQKEFQGDNGLAPH